jgi:LuxR family transcriptional regulator, maltose regulon positive regulatory protein
VHLAELLREQNELDMGMEQVTRGVELCRRLEFAWPLAPGLASLSWIRQARGDSEGARDAMGEAERALPDPRLIALFNPAPTESARLALVQGDVDAAIRWVRAHGLGANDEPSYPRENEYLVLVRVLLATQAPDKALRLLERLHAQAVAQQRTGSVIKVRTLQALALSASGDQARALDALTEAIVLGAPEGYVRLFVDEGPSMAGLLRQLVMSRRKERAATAPYLPRDHLSRLLDAFEQAGLPARPPVRGGVVAPGLVEPLSTRELEVLRLLAASASNKTIARELVITLDTVKRHISHLFSKLEVNSRTQAVARAGELGLLPSISRRPS